MYLLVNDGIKAYQYCSGPPQDRQTDMHTDTRTCALTQTLPSPRLTSSALSSLLVLPSAHLRTFCRARDRAAVLRENLPRRFLLWLERADTLCGHHFTLKPLTSLLISASNVSGFGMSQKVGHMDFFPNGGKQMPGCKRSSFSTFIDINGIWQGT